MDKRIHTIDCTYMTPRKARKTLNAARQAIVTADPQSYHVILATKNVHHGR
jgi:hypothetical protein